MSELVDSKGRDSRLFPAGRAGKTVGQKRKGGASPRTPNAVIYEVIMPHIKIKSNEKWNGGEKGIKGLGLSERRQGRIPLPAIAWASLTGSDRLSLLSCSALEADIDCYSRLWL